jgi:hypothetical protein
MMPEIDATGWAAIIGAVFLGFSSLLIQVLTIMIAFVRGDRIRNAIEVAARDHKSHEQISHDTKSEVHSVHVLVNDAMNTQLRISAVALRRIADISQSVGDIAAAEAAERLLQEHELKQKLVDDLEASRGRTE